jgi:hypothetical protein
VDDRRVRLTVSQPHVNVRASTSYKPMGVHGLLQRFLQLFHSYVTIALPSLLEYNTHTNIYIECFGNTRHNINEFCICR